MIFRLVEDISNTPNKLYHATYKQFLKSIQQKGLGNTKRKMWGDSQNGVVYLANDPWVAESYAEEAEWLDRVEDPDKYIDNIVIIEIDTTGLDKNNLCVDSNVQLDEEEENTTWEYHGIIPWSICKVYNTINEASIDPEGKYTDYGTGKVVDDNIFDDRTHVSYYDDLFDDPKYMAEEKNLKGHIEMMSPREYYEICSKVIFPNSSVDDLIHSRKCDPKVIEEIKEIIVKYKRQVFLPYINYAEKNQEGLHRMLAAAEIFGWEHKFPVLIIEWVDEERAKRRERERIESRIRSEIEDAVKSSLRYEFDNMGEFEEEVKAQVARNFDYMDREVESFSVTHNEDETTDVNVNGVVYQFDTERIKITPSVNSDDDVDLDIDLDNVDWDDLDIELDDLSMDEFLKKYGIA